jgi:disulfide oxidoreductase YuzD
MKSLTTTLLFLFLGFSLVSCFDTDRIVGNGNLKTKDVNIVPKSKLKAKGSIDIQVVQAAESSIQIQADENILPFIVVENNEDGETVVKTKSGYSLSTNNVILVTYTSPNVESITIAGSGNIVTQNKINNSTEFKVSIAGSGNATINVHSPKVVAKIAGSGNINSSGETRDLQVTISGNGDYKGENLMAENATVKISGSGNVRLHADATLNVNISGSGDVYYRGNPTITEKTHGSGNIKRVEEN